MKYLSKLTLLTLALFLIGGITACSDFLDPTLAQNKTISTIHSLNDLQGLMFGAYSTLSSTNLYGRDYVILGDVRTDNAISNGLSGRFVQVALFNTTLTDGNIGALGMWDDAYEIIRNCNIVIHSNVTGKGVDQVKGEAYAMRAFAHMILLKMYGQEFVDGSNLGVPYVTTFDKEENFYPKRSTVKQDLAKIEADYKKGISLMDPAIHDDVTQMNYWAAKALLSRFYLFTDNYSAAAQTAHDIIKSHVYSLVPANQYVAAWAKDGEPSVMFESAMTLTDNRGSGSMFYILLGKTYGDVEVTQELYQLFGKNDVRRKLYDVDVTAYDKGVPRANYRITGKYPDYYKNTPIIRYAEVILTYAEAKARPGPQQNKAKALHYLNLIASHRYTNGFQYSKATVDNILKERRKELAMEGLYYWQLLRTGQGITRENMRSSLSYFELNIPMGDSRLAYPIPRQEIAANPNLKQNLGYSGS